MPWVIPSHQAPALWLKLWRSEWFSGLGLVLGTIAPDLEFVLRLDDEWVVSHTLLGQLYFTAPAVVAAHWLLTRVLLPWLAPFLTGAAPFYWCELSRPTPARGRGVLRVAASGALGGLTHIFLDGFTHDGPSGWAVARFSVLRTGITTPFGTQPLFALLQPGLSLVLAVITLCLWSVLARRQRSRRWRVSPEAWRDAPAPRVRLIATIAVCGILGAWMAFFLRPGAALLKALELAAYGFFDFALLAMLACALYRRPAADREGV
jgi:hypothetical protein